MLDWKRLSTLPDDELGKLDIIRVNMACAVDIPGTEHFDVEGCVRKVDWFAKQVRAYTEPRLVFFEKDPVSYHQSEAYFRVLAMVTHLERDLGIHYNAIKSSPTSELAPDDCFVQGALLGDGGICGTLPLVNIAVGRRLGYPLKLVLAHNKREHVGHAFARWDEPLERFNVDSAGRGLKRETDEFYLSGQFAMSRQEAAACGFLKSLTPRQELANFLASRAHCLQRAGQRNRSMEAMICAHGIWPEALAIANWLRIEFTKWKKELDVRTPHGFPRVEPGEKVHKRFPAGTLERVAATMTYLEVTENLLNTPDLERRFWGPLRRGHYPKPRPLVARVNTDATGYSVGLEMGSDEGPFSYYTATT